MMKPVVIRHIVDASRSEKTSLQYTIQTTVQIHSAKGTTKMLAEWHAQIESSILGKCLSPHNLKQLLGMGQLIELRSGTYLFKEGDDQPFLFLLLEGRLDLAMTVRGRGECRILTLGAGDLVAWSAVLGVGIMSSSALCTQDAKLIAVSGNSLSLMFEEDSRFGYEFMKMIATSLAKRLIATRLQLLDLFSTAF